MYSKFLSIPQDKQERIINAAANEFAKNGFDKASTNHMIEAAGISKGLLFHYFTTKKSLFLYLYRYFTLLFTTEIYEHIDITDRDFFHRMEQGSKEKLKLIKSYPHSFQFVEAAFLDTSHVINEDIKRINEEYITKSNVLFVNLDYSKFKEGLDFEKVSKIAIWTFQGLGNEYALKARLAGLPIDYESAFHEGAAYIQLLRKSFYKEEFV